MQWRKKIGDIFKKALTSGCTPQKLTYSCCLALYIAFSPFPGAHTIMMIVSAYIFGLHFPTLFIIGSINNPWTAIPFYSFDYAFGYWFVHSLLGWNPSLVISLAKLFGSGEICLWSFFIGGNVLGIISALIAYPIATKFFNRLAKNHAAQ